jgi:hypothetical protein
MAEPTFTELEDAALRAEREGRWRTAALAWDRAARKAGSWMHRCRCEDLAEQARRQADRIADLSELADR